MTSGATPACLAVGGEVDFTPLFVLYGESVTKAAGARERPRRPRVGEPCGNGEACVWRDEAAGEPPAACLMITDQFAYAPGALAEAYFTLPAGYKTAANIPVGHH